MSSGQDLTIAPEAGPDLLDGPSAGRAAIRGSVLRTAGYVAGVLMSLVSVPLLIRHLGFGEYGHYVLVISLVTVVQGITDIGLSQVGVREYAIRPASERERLMRNLLGIRVALTSTGVMIAIAFAFAAGYSSPVIAGTALAGVGMVLTVAQGTFAIPLAAKLRLGWVSALEVLRQTLSVAAIVGLVLVGASLVPFLAVTIPVAAVVLVATVALVAGTMPMSPSFERVEWVAVLRVVLPFAAAVVIGTAYLRITIVLMSLLASKLQNGYYSTSYTVISVLIAIPALTVGATLPVLSRAARDDRERLGYVITRLIEVTLMVGVGIALALAIGAAFVIHVLTGRQPANAVTVLQIQAVAVVTQFVGASWQYGLLAMHRHRALLIISAACLTISVTLSVILVPALAARGAAIAFTAAEIALAALSYALLRRARPSTETSMRVPAKVCGAAVLGAAVLLIPGIGSFAAAVLASAIYLSALIVLKAVPTELLDALLRRRSAAHQ